MWRPAAPSRRWGAQLQTCVLLLPFVPACQPPYSGLRMPHHLNTCTPANPQEQTTAAAQDEGDELLAAVASAPEAPAPTPAAGATDEPVGNSTASAQPEPAAIAAARSASSKLPRPPSRPSSRPTSASAAKPNPAGSSGSVSRPASRTSQPGSRPGSRPTSRSSARPPAAAAPPTTVAAALQNLLGQAQPADPVADLNVIRAAATEDKDSLEASTGCCWFY